MTSARRTGAALVPTLLAAALATAALAAPASAAAQPDLRPIVAKYRATVEACKAPVDGGKVQVFARLDNTRNPRSEVRSSNISVIRDGQQTSKLLGLPQTAGRATSRTKSMTFSRGGQIVLVVAVNASQYGGFRKVALQDLTAC